MAPLTRDQKNALWRSTLALLAVVAVLFLLLRLNKPRAKPVRFDAVCGGFVAPIELPLKLHAGGGEVQEVMADGFDATIGNVESVTLVVDGSSLGELKGQRFKLERNADVNQTPSRLDVTPSGGLGRAELQVGRGGLISSLGSADARPWVRVESAEGAEVQTVLVSAMSALKGNRYGVSGIASPRLPKRTVESLEASVKGAVPGAMVSLDSRVPGVAVRVWFRPDMEGVPLFQRGIAGQSRTELSEGEVGTVQLVLKGCVNPDLRIEERSATGVIGDHKTDLTMDAISGAIDEISITGGAEKMDAPRLRVRGMVQVSSMQQDERELLPTLVGEVMDLPYAQRGVALILLGFVLFLAFKVVDRTLGVLLEYFFPRI